MKYLLVLLLMCSPVNAEEVFNADQAEQQAFTTYKELKQQEKFVKDIGKKTQKALNTMVKVATHHMARRGYLDAPKLLKEWEQNYSKVFLHADFESLDYNHPVFAWLDAFYLQLEQILGQKVLESLNLTDIQELNHGIPAVFHPKGYEQDHYRVHFVPVGKALGYWTPYVACSIYNFAGAPVTRLVCGPISMAGRALLGLIADQISDSVWRKFH